jgi:hypothetical protein
VYSEIKLINNDINSEALQIYPNPAKDFIVVKAKNIIESVYVFDASGKVQISKSDVANKEIRVDVSKLASGSYVVKVKSNGKFSTEYFAK